MPHESACGSSFVRGRVLCSPSAFSLFLCPCGTFILCGVSSSARTRDTLSRTSIRFVSETSIQWLGWCWRVRLAFRHAEHAQAKTAAPCYLCSADALIRFALCICADVGGPAGGEQEPRAAAAGLGRRALLGKSGVQHEGGFALPSIRR